MTNATTCPDENYTAVILESAAMRNDKYVEDSRILWEQAWPYLQRHLHWHGFVSTEEQRTCSDQWLDMKGAIDGFAVTAQNYLEAFQFKMSKRPERLFSVRTSTLQGYGPTEWDRIQRPLRPDWFIKAYATEDLALAALAVIPTVQLVDLIHNGGAVAHQWPDGSYYDLPWHFGTVLHESGLASRLAAG